MLRKAKRLPVIVMLVLITVFLGSLSGCGDSADPLGTGIIQFYDASTGVIITSITIEPGGSVTLVVRVRNLRSDGTTWVPVIGEKVTFTLLTPGNGGGLTVMNDRTAGNGQAMAVFTAGNNSATDSVRATTSNGAMASIAITKTGGIVGGISTLAAVPTTVAAYQTSTVTATVTDGNTKPMLGEAVTFTIPINQSDACFINAASGCVASITVNTDASGHAVALYRGGGFNPSSTVSDTIRAALANGSSNAIAITRSATAFSITVGALPQTLAVVGGGSSVITAKVTATTGTTTSNVSGVTVAFTTAGGSVSPASATTDGSGNAVTTFSASGGAAGTTAGAITARITIDSATYSSAVVINYE